MHKIFILLGIIFVLNAIFPRQTSAQGFVERNWETCIEWERVEGSQTEYECVKYGDGTHRIATLQGLEGTFASVISIILALGSIAVFIMFLVAGFKYITAGGEPGAIKQAQNTLTYAVGGLVILAVAYLILVFVEQFTGIEVTRFKIFQASSIP